MADLTWSAIVAILAVHVLGTWVGLRLAGEDHLTADLRDFLYFYVTTASTVGYGDLSPASHAGRLVGAAWLLPGAVALFTLALGKTATGLGTLWRRRMDGAGDYGTRTGHTVILGWQGARTRRLVEQLSRDAANGDRPVLVSKSLDRNPMPDEIDFVAVDALSVPDGHARAGAAGARTVIVRGEDDDETLAATLAAVTSFPGAHVVAHFEDERARDLILRQCPTVEAVSSLSTEILVRASRDPGASRVADLLFDAGSGDTVYSMTVPHGVPADVDYARALAGLRSGHAITLIGAADPGGATDLNRPADTPVVAGSTLYYIGDARVDAADVRWGSL